jgi:RNA polymerase subunit RPABC4/transcription elongation factor Spt4
MAIDYSAICPTLSQYIAIETITADTTPVEPSAEEPTTLTQSLIEEVYGMLVVDPQYLTIAMATGVTEPQVKAMHDEILAFTNYTE